MKSNKLLFQHLYNPSSLLFYRFIFSSYPTLIGNALIRRGILLNKVSIINRHDRIGCRYTYNINIYCGILLNKTFKKCKLFYFHSIIIIFSRRHNFIFSPLKYLETTHLFIRSCLWLEFVIILQKISNRISHAYN